MSNQTTIKVSQLETLLSFNTIEELIVSGEKRSNNTITVTSIDTPNCMTEISNKQDAKLYAEKFISKYGDLEFTTGLWANSYEPSTTPVEIKEANQVNIEAVQSFNGEVKETFRAKVFKRAYQIMRETNKTFSVCLSKAWALYRLSKKMLNTTEVSFTYEKLNGTLRRAYGTLKGVSGLIKGKNKSKEGVFTYWDTKANGFRSFRIENLITVF